MCFDWLRRWICDHPNTIAFGEDKNGRVTMKYHRDVIACQISEQSLMIYENGFENGSMERLHVDVLGWQHWVVRCKRQGNKRSRAEHEPTLTSTDDDNTDMSCLNEKDYNEWMDSLP